MYALTLSQCIVIIGSQGYLTCRNLLSLLYLNQEFYSFIRKNEQNLLTYLIQSTQLYLDHDSEPLHSNRSRPSYLSSYIINDPFFWITIIVYHRRKKSFNLSLCAPRTIARIQSIEQNKNWYSDKVLAPIRVQTIQDYLRKYQWSHIKLSSWYSSWLALLRQQSSLLTMNQQREITYLVNEYKKLYKPEFIWCSAPQSNKGSMFSHYICSRGSICEYCLFNRSYSQPNNIHKQIQHYHLIYNKSPSCSDS